ncbi:PREDICTED: uncharacterized protein LOC109590785 [Amphimedon queenslandica]|uniref:Uncharacterized protein n=1 Tax=Amphimedon queenslandica TaxID=400682 RepID=A0AAN0JZ69_AMPQE|nr:PREDICTED: uncharacterized protein LOC109590785 [Amphimedon queenslandica]|eukprot:XP_019862219.1 PREDICTED: uncharacterized protein LOC109590785 [Amphimedon queenslandica]
MPLVIIIKDNCINQQPTPLSCELTVTGLIQSSIDCLHERLFIFTNVTEGDEYNYTVTITNVIGSAVKNGFIEIPYLPFEVYPSEIQYLPSTKTMISPCSLILGTDSSTPASTPSDSCNCVLPWTVGVLIGVAVMTVI